MPCSKGKMGVFSSDLEKLLCQKFDSFRPIIRLQVAFQLVNNEFWKNLTVLSFVGLNASICDDNGMPVISVPMSDSAAVEGILEAAVGISKIHMKNGAGSSNAQRLKALAAISKMDRLVVKQLVIGGDWFNRAASLHYMKKLLDKNRLALELFAIIGDVRVARRPGELWLLFNCGVIDPLAVHFLTGLTASKVHIGFMQGRCQSSNVILDFLHQFGATEVTLRNCSHVITGPEMRVYSAKKKLAVQALKLIETDRLYPFSRNAPVGRLRSVADLMGLMPQLTVVDIEEIEFAQELLDLHEKLLFPPEATDEQMLSVERERSAKLLAKSIAQTAVIALSRYKSAPFAFKLAYQFPCTVNDMQVMVVAKESVKAKCQAEADFVAEGMTFANGQCTVRLEFLNDQ